MLSMEIESDGDWDSIGAPVGALAERALHAAVAESEVPGIAEGPREFEVSLALTDDTTVHRLNREWRDKDRPTNVLSFPMMAPDQLAASDGPPALLGDIALAYGTCRREAEEKGIALADHATHLMVHGMLHLLGHDHQDDASAGDMEARETRALRRLGLADPYGDRD